MRALPKLPKKERRRIVRALARAVRPIGTAIGLSDDDPYLLALSDLLIEALRRYVDEPAQ